MLVGESNPYPGTQALAPVNSSCTGYRIWAMINSVAPLTHEEYTAAFDRLNLCAGGWSSVEAVEVARDIKSSAEPGSTVVLLGQRVSHLFGMKGTNPSILGGVRYFEIPHPSGLNRYYNDKVLRREVAVFLASLYRETKICRSR